MAKLSAEIKDGKIAVTMSGTGEDMIAAFVAITKSVVTSVINANIPVEDAVTLVTDAFDFAVSKVVSGNTGTTCTVSSVVLDELLKQLEDERNAT